MGVVAAFAVGGGVVRDYNAFLTTKRLVAPTVGREVIPGELHPSLFPFQRDLTGWALRKGRAALFADTGLGKTRMQLEWAHQTGERVLIVAPLSVARQTVNEAAKLGRWVHYTRSGDDLSAGVNITNYEMIGQFDPRDFGAVVLDESSILKGLDGKTRTKLTAMFAQTPYRLCATATPAPNDISEIANHAEFLGIMTRAEMLAAFFIHDDKGWRLKGHATEGFYRWLASWGMSVRFPSDLGYSDDGYILPPLSVAPVWVDTDFTREGQLFSTGLRGIQDRMAVRRATIGDKVAATAEMVNASADQWIVWCGLNPEGRALHDAIPGSVLQEGSDTSEAKQAAIEGFQDGRHRVLITKAKIAGFGLNLQNAHEQAFCGLSDSWEMFYQCVRRSYRFGQQHPVNVRVVLSRAEEEIFENVMHKEEEANRMREGLLEAVRNFEREELGTINARSDYQPTVPLRLPQWLVSA